MGRIKEPTIYSGYVIMMIGQDAGKRIPMDYAAAQSCVVSGTARWEDDTSPVDKALKAEVERRAVERQAEIDADAERNRKLKEAPASVDDALIATAGRIALVDVEEESGTKTYLARPFPVVAYFLEEFLADGHPASEFIAVIDDDGNNNDGVEDGDIVFSVENGIARYREIARRDGLVYAELKEVAQPEVEIPDDWRDRHFLTNMSAAKAIRALDNKAKMKKDEAEAIIEGWVSTDDPIRAEEPAPGKETNENGRILDGNHEGSGAKDENGQEISAEEAARRKAQEFLNDDFE